MVDADGCFSRAAGQTLNLCSFRSGERKRPPDCSLLRMTLGLKYLLLWNSHETTHWCLEGSLWKHSCVSLINGSRSSLLLNYHL